MTGRTWYHTIELPDGSCTPGYYDTRAVPRHVDWPPELVGGRCLDVGTFDGFWAFEMERRGAGEVVAIDVDDPDRLDWAYDYREWGPAAIREWGSGRGPGFEEVARALGSEVRRVDRSVYDLSADDDGLFDVVLCGALVLHLRDPVRALEAMRGVCRGTLVLIECLDPQLELLLRVPAARLHPHRDEWWRCNSAGLVELVQLAGFEVSSRSARFVFPLGPGAPRSQRLSRLGAALAGRPLERGNLARVIIARPRPPNPDRVLR